MHYYVVDTNMPPRSKLYKRKGRVDPIVERLEAKKETNNPLTASERKRRVEANPPKKRPYVSKKRKVVKKPAGEEPAEDPMLEDKTDEDKSEDESGDSGSKESRSDDGDGKEGTEESEESGEPGGSGDDDDDGEDVHVHGGAMYFPRGPRKLSSLKSYENHVAYHIWKSYTEKYYP